jgi:hypothetical protein
MWRLERAWVGLRLRGLDLLGRDGGLVVVMVEGWFWFWFDWLGLVL